jgi:hypothetical protein
MLALLGCQPRPVAQPPRLITFPGTSTPVCAREEILPKITDVRPEDVRPGSQVMVMASGGYFRDTCGAYDESARVYQLYIDDEPVADLMCYANHCQAEFMLAKTTTVGIHCMGVLKGTCQVKFEVAAE